MYQKMIDRIDRQEPVVLASAFKSSALAHCRHGGNRSDKEEYGVYSAIRSTGAGRRTYRTTPHCSLPPTKSGHTCPARNSPADCGRPSSSHDKDHRADLERQQTKPAQWLAIKHDTASSASMTFEPKVTAHSVARVRRGAAETLTKSQTSNTSRASSWSYELHKDTPPTHPGK